MYRLLVPSGTTGINAAELSVTYSGDPSTRSIFSMWTVPAADLSSQTPVDHDATFDASTTATSLTLDISTSLGGFYIAISYAQVSTSYTWSGDEGTLTERFDTFQAGATHSGADANNTAAATNTNTITATFGAGGLDELVAGSWGASSSPPPPPTFNPGWVNRATSGVAGSGVF
jgi:hypothetical protein